MDGKVRFDKSRQRRFPNKIVRALVTYNLRNLTRIIAVSQGIRLPHDYPKKKKFASLAEELARGSVDFFVDAYRAGTLTRVMRDGKNEDRHSGS